jgi:hypothetical protein
LIDLNAGAGTAADYVEILPERAKIRLAVGLAVMLQGELNRFACAHLTAV